MPQPPPLHARFHWYKLTPSEFLVLKAMVEHCWDGSVLWPAVPRIAAYSKLDEKTVQRVLHGYTEKRKKSGKVEQITHIGLIARGVLTLVQPAVPGKRKSATYRLNEAVLELDPKMRDYLSEEQQAEFPEMDLPTPHGKPIRPKQKKLPGIGDAGSNAARPRQKNLPGLGQIVASEQPATGDTVSPICPPDLATNCRGTGDKLSPNYLDEFLRGEQCFSQEGVSGFEVLDPVKTPVNASTNDADHAAVENLGKGLREILASLDDHAVRHIWRECRKSVPDVTPEEVLYFAWSKRTALERANNPAGLLIHAVTLACDQKSIDRLRTEVRRADDERRIEVRRKQDLIEQAEAALAAMPEAERSALQARINADIQRHLPNTSPESQRDIARKLLLEEALARPRAPNSS